MKQTKILLYCWLTVVITLCAATNAPAAGRGAFAGDSVGARASIFGEAFVAVADDANALKWNPAGITQLLQPEFTSSHINFFSLGGYVDYSKSNSINEDFIGLAWPTRYAPVGISLLNLGTPGLPLADDRGAVTDSYGNYSERTLTFSVGKELKAGSFGISGGCNLNYYSLGGGSDSSGVGMDGGLMIKTPGILPEIGVMMRGLFMDAVMTGGTTIPAKTDLALAFSPFRWVKMMAGLSKVSGDSVTQYSTGIELGTHWLSPFHFSVQAGYKTLGSYENGDINIEPENWATGMSLRISRYKLDYAYEQNDLLGDTHRVTLGIFKDSPENFHLNRGRLAFEQLDDDAAMREFEQVVYLSPRKVEVYHMLALTYERMRLNQEAIRVLQRIQSLNFDYFIEHKLDQLLRDIEAQE